MTTGLLADKVTLVLGASRGIGAAAARLFAREGATVVVGSRDERALRQLCEELPGSSYVVTDVTDPSSAAAAVETVVERHGRLDAAFNNAGANTAPHRLADFPADDFDRIVAVNLNGVFYAMAAEIAAMARTGGGTIVNTSSVGGLRADPGLSAYSAAKRGVISLTESAAAGHGREGVRVNAVAPGLVLTEMVTDWERDDPGVVQRIVEANPLGRAGTEDEVAQAVAWLLSDRSSYVTGATLAVTGGTGL